VAVVVYLCDEAEEAIVVWSEYEALIIICHPTTQGSWPVGVPGILLHDTPYTQ
jgi:hypothetical protein